MLLDHFLEDARADAERRALPELVPLLETLRSTLARLRAADWNDTLEGRVDTSLGPAPVGAGARGREGERLA